MATEPTRAAALGAVLFLALGTAACSADSDGADKLLKQTPLVKTCGGIFNQQMNKEARSPRVHVVKTDSYRETAAYLKRPEAHNHFASKEFCRLTPLEKDKQIASLVSINVAWETARPQNGKSAEWQSPTNGGKFAGELVVLCPNPSGKKYEEDHALSFYLFNELRLSDNSRAKLLISAAKKIIPHMGCKNKVTYPDPDKVAPR